ncbi:MAG: SDR family NAD(P)-dependent oxidoreductase, partial [Ramlibacter sp.]
MTSHLTVLTGASRGMGLAMAGQLLDAGHDLLCISRKHNDALALQATGLQRRCEQWPMDLARPDAAAARLEAWLANLPGAATLASVTLINNAAMVPAIAPLAALPAQEIADAMRVDLEAPLLLTSVFLRATREWKAARKVLNISSGLGRRAMASQALYCAAKAGMDHFTRCVSLEEAGRPNGA